MIRSLVGGTASGVGKTMIIACLPRQGYVVQPHKGGPDSLASNVRLNFAANPTVAWHFAPAIRADRQTGAATA